MAKREARSPRFNYRGTLRLSYNCPYYWVNYCPRNEGVNPHYGVFLGDTLPPETSINSPVCYGRGVGNFWSKELRFLAVEALRPLAEKKERVQLF